MPARVNVLMKLEGGEALRKALQRAHLPFLEEMARALPDEGRELGAQSVALAPSRSGALVSSLSVTTARPRNRVKVAVAYLDEKAAAVHEGVHWGRKIKGTGGRKFFERALHAFEAGFLERMAARLKRLVGGK